MPIYRWKSYANGAGPERRATTLLGLHQAAGLAGFKAEGARAGSVDDLEEVMHPCILHVTMEGAGLHYVVYFAGKEENSWSAILPGGLSIFSGMNWRKYGSSHTLLLLEPGEK